MPIDKGLYQAPQGLESIIGSNEPDIEIEIEDPEAVHIGIDGMEIDIEPEQEGPEDFNANLAEYISDDQLVAIAGDLLADFEDLQLWHLIL